MMTIYSKTRSEIQESIGSEIEKSWKHIASNRRRAVSILPAASSIWATCGDCCRDRIIALRNAREGAMSKELGLLKLPRDLSDDPRDVDLLDDVRLRRTDFDALVEALRAIKTFKVVDNRYYIGIKGPNGGWSVECPEEMTPFVEG